MRSEDVQRFSHRLCFSSPPPAAEHTRCVYLSGIEPPTFAWRCKWLTGEVGEQRVFLCTPCVFVVGRTVRSRQHAPLSSGRFAFAVFPPIPQAKRWC